MMSPIRDRGLSPSVVLFSSLFAAQAAILVLSPILPQVAAEFGVTTSTAAQLRAVSGVTAGLVALLVAARGGRFPLVRLLNGGLILLAIGALGSALAPTFLVLLLAQVPVGLGLALVLSSGLAAADTWSEPGEGAKTLSWALVGQPVAWIVGQPVVGAVASVDWRWTWVAVPLASAIVAIAAVAMRRASASGGLEDCDPTGLIRLPHMKNWMFGELMAFSAWAGTLVFAGAFFIETYDLGVGATGVILGVVAAVYVPGNFLGRRLLQKGPGRGVLLVSALSLAVGAVALAGLQIGLVYSVVILSVLGFLAGMRTIAGASVGLRLADGRRLASMSVRTSTLQFGYLIGTLVGGLVLPIWGYAGVWLVYAALFAGAGIVHMRRHPSLAGDLVAQSPGEST